MAISHALRRFSSLGEIRPIWENFYVVLWRKPFFSAVFLLGRIVYKLWKIKVYWTKFWFTLEVPFIDILAVSGIVLESDENKLWSVLPRSFAPWRTQNILAMTFLCLTFLKLRSLLTRLSCLPYLEIYFENKNMKMNFWFKMLLSALCVAMGTGCDFHNSAVFSTYLSGIGLHPLDGRGMRCIWFASLL